MDVLPNPYDEVSYPVYARPQTHPDRLATLATLAGMQPQPIENCRVLEIGGGEGGNLIPMAFDLTESEFVGIELSATAVTRGQAMINELGLKNVALRCFDLMNASPDLGRFDYIIAHGVYSWVPPEVSEKIFSLCQMCLAPEGVAYVSYNTQPGGHWRMMLREMMQFHIRGFSSAAEQIKQARAFLNFLIEAQTERTAYSDFLRQEQMRFSDYHDGHLYHDDLERDYHPVMFDEFIVRAAAYDLQFLCETEFSEMSDYSIAPHARTALTDIAKGKLRLEQQYADFLKCRSFRQTLLCRAETKLDRQLKSERVRKLRIAAATRLRQATPQQFRAGAETDVMVNNALGRAALSCLSEQWPRSLSFDELLTEARIRRGSGRTDEDDPVYDALQLCEAILRAYAVGAVELRVHEPHFTIEASERPYASPLARLQIARSASVITNLRHDNVQMDDELAKRLITLLDGTRDHARLASDLASLVESGEVEIEDNDAPVKSKEAARRLFAAALEGKLNELARLSLLVE